MKLLHILSSVFPLVLLSPLPPFPPLLPLASLLQMAEEGMDGAAMMGDAAMGMDMAMMGGC